MGNNVVNSASETSQEKLANKYINHYDYDYATKAIVNF